MGMKPLRQRSLKMRVTLFTLLIFLVSIWSLEFFVSHRLRDDIHDLLAKQQFSTVSFMAAEADRELERLLHRMYCRGRHQTRSRAGQIERARARVAAEAAT